MNNFRTIVLLVSLIHLGASSYAGDRIDYERSFAIAQLEKTRSGLLSSLETYFDTHRPTDEVYENAEHQKYVRLCGYKLTKLYYEMGKKKKARFYFDWLEKNVVSLKDPSLNRKYVIRPGDTFSKIAQQHDMTVSELIRLNPDSDPRRLRIGQKLNVPNPPTP